MPRLIVYAYDAASGTTLALRHFDADREEDRAEEALLELVKEHHRDPDVEVEAVVREDVDGFLRERPEVGEGWGG